MQQAVINSRLWWASPASFNDPYDCRPRITFDAGPLKRAAIARRILKESGMSSNASEKKVAIRRASRINVGSFVGDLEQKAAGWIRDSAVCCFTRDPSNLLMWGHYADSHRGVGLVFSEVAGDEIWAAFDVVYTDARPVVDFGEELRASRFVEAILQKASSWSYEHESRMIEYREAAGYRSFPRLCLIGLILGSRISLEDERWAIDLVLRHRPGLQIYRARLSATEYRVEIGQRDDDRADAGRLRTLD